MRRISLALSLAACLASAPSGAFKIDPWSYRPFGVSPRGIESQLESLIHNPRLLLLGPLAMGARLPASIGQLKEPAHENLTELSIRCARAPLARAGAHSAAGTTPATGNEPVPGMIARCAGRDGPLQKHAPDLGAEAEELIRAVRFNDAPPVKTARALMALVTPSALICGEVRVPENAGCWAMLMSHAAGLAALDPGHAQFGRSGNLLYRSHFGDMQFMHAMASRGDTLAHAHERLLLWAQFTYQVADGEIAPATVIGTLPRFASILAGFETSTAADFFEVRGGAAPGRVARLALGALLHTVQDSFAAGHAERETLGGTNFGAISALHDYSCQSDEKHGNADHAGHYAWFNAITHEANSPVTIGAQLIDLLARKIKWDDAPGEAGSGTVAQYLRETVFPIVSANAALVAGAGARFSRTNPVAATPSGTPSGAPSGAQSGTRSSAGGIISAAHADTPAARSGALPCPE